MVRKNEIKTKGKGILNLVLVISALFILAFAIISTAPVHAVDTVRPTIVGVTPKNNQLSVETHDVITVKFSEQMDPNTINRNTFVVEQRTTPDANSQQSEYRSRQLEGIVTYDSYSRTATFTPEEGQTANPMQPNQEFGNVFTATITTGAKDLEGNSLSENYIWSFSTGDNPFNTGGSTSQQQQPTVPVSTSETTNPSTTAPIITGDATGTQTTTGNFTWNWLIIVLAMLVLVVLVAALFINPKKEKVKKTAPTQKHNHPFGDVHSVKEIEGIGPEYNKALLAMGIKDTKQLWKANAMRVARETGAPLSSVKSWQNMAELATIHDIGPQYAELLERSGIHSIAQLRNYTPKQLLKRVTEKQDSIDMSIQGNVPGHALVENWIDQARNHTFNVSEGQTA